MKKKDVYFIIICVIVSVLAYLGFDFYMASQRPDTPSSLAYVYYQNELAFSFDINEDHTYDLQGDYGMFYIEVKDGQYRANNVDCPNHICEQEGWVKDGEYHRQIVCSPNNIYIIQK